MALPDRTTVQRATVGLNSQIVLGPVLIAVWWTIAWSQLRPFSDYYFFPLWLGYILTIDGIVQLRTGTSLWRRSQRRFVALFIVSIPFWWLFETINQFIQNWHYHSPRPYSPLAYGVLASLSFSTVVPAVLETTELLASLRLGDRLPGLPSWRFGRPALVGFHLLGWLLGGLVVLFPRHAFPLAWLSIFFLIEPINAAVGQRSIARYVAAGRWAAVWNLMLATMLTGFFWEMWNSQALPKWTYSVPFVEFGHLFEMPILGYFGYWPFGLEVFACFALVFWLFERRQQIYARLDAAEAGSFDRLEGQPL